MKAQFVLFATLTMLLVSTSAEAGWLDRLFARKQPQQDRFARAGNPHCIAPWAKCASGSKYCGYFVGGGAVLTRGRASRLVGESRYADEGTWGMDYSPWNTRVSLGWYHGRRSQGGEGQYEPDEKNSSFSNLLGK